MLTRSSLAERMQGASADGPVPLADFYEVYLPARYTGLFARSSHSQKGPVGVLLPAYRPLPSGMGCQSRRSEGTCRLIYTSAVSMAIHA